MTFKKLALVSAIAMAPMASYAVEALDDAALSATTGQDGIELSLDLAVNTNTLIHDKDGLSGIAAASGYSFDGAIVVQNMSVDATGLIVQIDAGDNATSAAAPTLNIHVNLANGITIVTGSIHVANSRRDDGAWGGDGTTVTIINSATLVVGATQLDVQLGNEPQGAMITIAANITGGLNLTGMGISDLNSGGTIGSATLTLTDTGGTDLYVDTDINVTAAGLVVDVNTLGVGGMDVLIEDQYLGSVAAGIVGDIEMQALDLSGTQITISGK